MANIIVPDSELPAAGVLEASAPAVDGPATPAAVAAGLSSEPVPEVSAPPADVSLPAPVPDFSVAVGAPSGGPTVEAASALPPEPEEWNYFDDQANIRRMAADALARGDSERAARVAALADHYNASQVQVEMNLEQQEERFRKDQMETMLADLPFSAKYFQENPLDAPIFKDDLQPLALVEKQFGKLGSVQGWSPAIDPHTPASGTFSRERPLILGDDESTGDAELDERIQMIKRPGDYLADVAGRLGDWYKVGTLQTEQGLMWNRARQGFDAVDDRLLAEDKRLESEMKELTGDAEGNAIYEAAVVVGQMVSSLASASAVEGAAKGAAVGGASASVVPGIGTAAGLMGGAFLGAATQSTLDVEAGGSYRSMYQAGVSPTAARWLSTGVGAVNSLIEMAGIKVLGEAARPLMRTLTASFGAKTVNSALATPTMGSVLKNAALAYAGGMGEEAATEVMQEGVNIASEEIARLYAGGNFDAVNGEIIFDRLSEIAWKTLQATAVLGAVGGGAAMGVGAHKVSRANQTKEFFETMAKAVPEMKSAQLAPTKVQQLIAAQAEQAGAETTYIDGSEFRQAMIDQGVSLADLRQVAPEVADQVEAAAELGVDVEIPTASYATQLASTPLGTRLQDHVRLAPDALSVADVIKVDKARKALMRQIVKSTFDADEQRAADRFVDTVESKQWREESARIQNEIATSIAAAAPQFKESEVQTQARLGATMVTRLAQNVGLTPERMGTIAPKIIAPQATMRESETLAQPVDKFGLQRRSYEFDEQLRLWEQGKGRPDFNVGTPSWVLQIFGVRPEKGLHVSRSDFVHVLFPKGVTQFRRKGKHGIKAAELEGLLAAIQQPIAVFQSTSKDVKEGETALVLITELKSEQGNILAPIHLTMNKDGQILVANRIPTAYWKQRIRHWVESGLLLGYEKTKGLDLLLSDMGSNSRKSVLANATKTSANNRRPSPFDGVIVYENETSVGDLYKKSSDEVRGSFDPRANTIKLTPNADLSTFAHEMSHWYLANLLELSKLEGVDPSVTEDVAALIKDFGLKDVAEWDALGLEGQRKFHERFAYQAEIYLSTGQAPTRGLERFFARFAAWVRSVYSQWAGGAREALGAAYQAEFGEALPDINPGVKRVFDRMFVAQRDLDFAESANGLKSLFDEKPADMPEDQWRELMAARDESVAEGEARLFEAQAKDEKWYVNARLRQARRLDREAKAYRDRVREKVKARIDGRKEFVAFDALKTGGRALGIENLKIDPKSLEGMGLKPSVIKKLQDLGLTKKGGFPISATRQLLSPLARFKTNEQLVAGLIAGSQDRTKLIEDETSRICLENKSDYFDPKKKEELIQRAIHNEARGRMVATELKYLSGDKTMSARLIREAARQVALERFARMQAGKVSPKIFMAAESRASREAYTLLTKGDRLGAAIAKRKQLLNHELALMAIDFKRSMDKFDDLRKQVFKSDKELAKSRDVDVVAVARYILNASGLGRIRPRDMNADALEKTIAKFKNNAEEKFREYQAQLAPYAYSPGRNYDWKTYPTADIRSIMGQVSDLWKKAGDERRVVLNGRKHDLDEIVDQLVERASNRTDIYSAGYKSAVTEADKIRFTFLGFRAAMARVESWCRAMDGGEAGLFTKYIYQPVEDAVAKYKNENAAYQKRFADLIKSVNDNWVNTDAIDAPEIGYSFNTKAELIGALLHTGNESNKRKLLLGGRGTDPDTQQRRAWAHIEEDENGVQHLNTDAWDHFINRMFAEGKITKADMDFCQGVWDLLEETKPKAQAAYMEMYGYRFEEVQASPVVTPFGTYRGGYVPAMTDRHLYSKRDAQMKQEELEGSNFLKIMPVTKPGFSNSRVENFTQPLSLDVSALGSHISKVLRFADIAPAVMQVDKIVSSHRFQDALALHNPRLVSEMLKPFLTRAVGQVVTDGKSTWFDQKLNSLRALAGMNIMFMNVINTLQQVTGLSIAAVKVPPLMLARHFRNYALSPKKSAEFVMAASPFMKSRLDNFAYEYQSTMEEAGTHQPQSVAKAKGVINKLAAIHAKGDPLRSLMSRHGYILQTLAQYPIDVSVWSAAYEYNIGKGLSHEEAVHEADSVIRTTQSDFSPENIAGVEAGSALKRFFLVFYNYFNMQYNLLGERWALRKAQKRYGRFALDAALIVWVPSVVGKLISDALMGGSSDEDDPDDAFDALDFIQLTLGEPLKSLISTIPLAGSISSYFGAKFSQAGSPVAQAIWGKDPYLGRIGSAPAVSLVEGSINGAVDLARLLDGDDSVNGRTATRNIMDLSAMVTGVPVGGLKRPVGYAAGVLTGDIEAPDTTLQAVRGLVAGK